MDLLGPLVTSTKLAVSCIATVGSILVHHDPATGKDSVNLIPAIIWVYGLAALGCSLSQGEPFSQCVKGVLSIFGG